MKCTCGKVYTDDELLSLAAKIRSERNPKQFGKGNAAREAQKKSVEARKRNKRKMVELLGI